MSTDDLIRTFDTGATRGSDNGKLDFDGFLSPVVIERYSEYMDSHRLQPDGSTRDSDNWQHGIPIAQYMKSMWRHFFDVWKLHRGYTVTDRVSGNPIDMDEALCGLLFNAMGYLHEWVGHRATSRRDNGRILSGASTA